MKAVILLLCSFIIASCGSINTTNTIKIEPRLLKQSPLPEFKLSPHIDEFEFFCELIINDKGNVEKARLLRSSGDSEWDSLCTLSLLQWRFSPATSDGKAVKSVIRRRIKVVFNEPLLLHLGEIVCETRQSADSAYQELMNNSPFADVADRFSISDSKVNNGDLGKVNLLYFNEILRKEILELEPGDFTNPMPYGNHYIILKRFYY